MRLLWVVVGLVILLLGGLTGYAYFGDMKADPRETRLPVELDLGSEPTPTPAPVLGDASVSAPAKAAEPEPAGTVSPDAEQNDLD
ncbi:hypothetical protein [Paracoccus ravus]|uniref:hypothetical protein n=1 Tax=Paracoccus ravus TaxID=2447760 RepID=UPI00106DFC85|nr:hypothetical protein [Paracoccus ravus]